MTTDPLILWFPEAEIFAQLPFILVIMALNAFDYLKKPVLVLLFAGCTVNYTKLGCFKDDRKKSRPLPELLSTDRDSRSKVFSGKTIDWNNWDTYMIGFPHTPSAPLLAASANAWNATESHLPHNYASTVWRFGC